MAIQFATALHARRLKASGPRQLRQLRGYLKRVAAGHDKLMHPAAVRVDATGLERNSMHRSAPASEQE
jgi:hypothetical protein